MYPKDKRRGRSRFSAVLPLVAACTLAVASLAAAAGGQPAAPQSAPPRPQAQAAASPQAAVPLAIPFRRPSPAEAQAFLRGLEPFFAKSQESLVLKQSDHGMSAINLAGRFPSTAIAVAQPDGSLAWTCVGNLAEAAALLAEPSDLEVR